MLIRIAGSDGAYRYINPNHIIEVIDNAHNEGHCLIHFTNDYEIEVVGSAWSTVQLLRNE